MPGQNLIWHGTTGPAGTADGQSQPLPSLYLGDFRASQVLHSLESTLTASQAATSRHVLVDSAQIGAGLQAHRLKWLSLVTGAAAPAAARVEAFDTATGTYRLDRPLPGSAASGDRYRLWSRNNVWPDVSAAQAAAGETRYRCIALRNTHGSALANVRFYFRDLSAGAVGDFARVHQPAQTASFLARADDQTDLFDGTGARLTLGGPDGFSGSGAWQTPFAYATADTLVSSLLNATNIAVWLRRVVRPGAQLRRSVAVQLIAESTTTGSDPSPLITSCVLPYDVGGDTQAPEADLEIDRYVHVGGGTRITARVRRGAGPEANRVVRWVLRPGDLGSLHTDDTPFAGHDVTDAQGRTAATYRAPETPESAGFDAQPRLVIGAGEEIGEAFPRAPLAATIETGTDVRADLTQPELSRTYEDDPSLAFASSHE